MENKNLNKTPIADKFLDKLKSDQAKMKPKVYFALKSLLVALSILLASLFILYILSFIVFFLRVSGTLYLPSFGFYGICLFIMSLPWFLIIFALILIIILELLVKHFAFAYRRPILYSVLGIVIFVSLGSLIVDKTEMHPLLMRRAEEGRLPFAGRLYCENCFTKPDYILPGTVTGLTNDGFVLTTRNGKTIVIVITPETKMPPKINLENRNTVVVWGKNKNGFIEAQGIKIIDDKMKLFMQGNLYQKPPVKSRVVK